MSELTASEIAGFYDRFGQHLLSDYVYGNLRFARAIKRVLQSIPPGAARILDVGCGIGMSTAEIHRRYRNATILGVDISRENVRHATTLFAGERTSFKVSTLADGAIQGKFDFIAMIDVYEHIPKDKRADVHRSLSEYLSDEGVMVLTVPSALHQLDLAQNNPSGLQIVDETVTARDALALAEDVGGSLMRFEHVSVWRANDYVHIVIQRAPRLSPHSSATRLGTVVGALIRAPGRIRRRNHVRRALGIEMPLRRPRKQPKQ